jgi:hypothetical protein
LDIPVQFHYDLAMIPLFLGLAISNLLAITTTIALGYISVSGAANMRTWHMLSGALTMLLCVGVNCVVFTYFIATAKWIQHAVTVKNLNPQYTAPTRSFKAQALPASLIAILSVFLTAIGGAAADNRFLSINIHHILALCALAINLGCAAIQYSAISRNGKLIDNILADIPPTDIESQAV